LSLMRSALAIFGIFRLRLFVWFLLFHKEKIPFAMLLFYKI
jgi:hypothetical protein